MTNSPSKNHALLPGEASTLLSIVVYLFGATGALTLLGLALVLVGKLAGWSVMQPVKVGIAAVLLRALVAGGYLWTAWLLDRRRRLGGILGLSALALSVIPPLLSGVGYSSLDLLIPGFGIIALGLAWSHLESALPSSPRATRTSPSPPPAA